jgi:peptidoglycan/LPS O-acetylase OafA/YrhL
MGASLSAGLWFACIDFQLGLIYIAILDSRDAYARMSGRAEGEGAVAVLWLLGWALAVPSFFFFNIDSRWNVWAVYFFGQFFLGVIVYHGLQGDKSAILFWLYVAMIVAALVYCWRWRLATSLAAGLKLFFGGKLGLMERWPASRLIDNLGRTPYSLFLIHFPVLIVVTIWWVACDWSSSRQSAAGLVVSYLASLAAAEVFFGTVEAPAVQLSRKFSYAGALARRASVGHGGAFFGAHRPPLIAAREFPCSNDSKSRP